MSAPQKFRKKPVTIEAMQVTDNLRQHIAIRKWAASTVGEGQLIPVSITRFSSDMVIHTLEGDMTASVGDWIVRGVNGEFYPVKPDIFDKTYERAGDEQ